MFAHNSVENLHFCVPSRTSRCSDRHLCCVVNQCFATGWDLLDLCSICSCLCLFLLYHTSNLADFSTRIREGRMRQIGWIFGKVTKGGGRHFQSKIFVAYFGNFKQGFLSIISGFRVWFFQQLYWEKSKQGTLWRRHFWIPHTPHPLPERFFWARNCPFASSWI